MGTSRIGTRGRVFAVLFCTWLAAACGVDRGSIGGLSGDGGGSAGNGGTSGLDAGGSGGDSGASGNSGVGGGGTSGAGGSAGVISSDASLDSAVTDAEMNDASTTPDASVGDSGVAIHPDSCDGFRPLGGLAGGSCPSGWTTVDGITCRRVCMGVGALGNCPEITITCPSGFGCEVECQGVNTCPGKTIVCSDGPCAVTCGGVNSCAGVTLQCASDRCAASCATVMLGSVTASNPSASCTATNTCQ